MQAKIAFHVKTFAQRIDKTARVVYRKLTQNEKLEVNDMAHIDVPKVRGRMAYFAALEDLPPVDMDSTGLHHTK